MRRAGGLRAPAATVGRAPAHAAATNGFTMSKSNTILRLPYILQSYDKIKPGYSPGPDLFSRPSPGREPIGARHMRSPCPLGEEA